MLDLAEEWRKLDAVRHKPDAQAHWDNRARTYSFHDAPNDYVRSFIANMQLSGGESVLDMGCGTGSLAVPLAKMGHKVVAADFSEGMLERVRENASAAGVPVLEPAGEEAFDVPAGAVCPLHMSWEDDWSTVGLNENMADVAFASRSIAVADLRAALRKLCLIARRRCCITMTTGVSPRIDQKLLEELDVKVNPSRDYLYAFGMLAQAGFEPEVRFIHSKRKDSFASAEDAFGDFSQMIEIGRPDLSANELEEAKSRLRLWLSEHLVENPEAGQPDKKGYAQGPLTLDVERIVPWAFISWDPKGATL